MGEGKRRNDIYKLLYSKEYFQMKLSEEIERAKRCNRSLSLMMLEIKPVSHNLLFQVKELLRKNTRRTDLVVPDSFRAGRFTILFPDTSQINGLDPKIHWRNHLHHMVVVAKRLKEKIKQHTSKSLLINIGIGSFNYRYSKAKTEKELISSTEEALFRAKQEKEEKIERAENPGNRNLLEEEFLRAGKLRLSIERHLVYVGERIVHLTPKEFELLGILLRKKGCVLDKEFLFQKVWGYTSSLITTRTLDTHIRNLRRKLGNEGKGIITVKGVGYKFVEGA